MTKIKLLSLPTTAAVFVSLLFTGVAPTSNAQAASYIKVHYTLKKGNKAFSHKSFKVKKNAKVMTGLKKVGTLKALMALLLVLLAEAKIRVRISTGLTPLTASMLLKEHTNNHCIETTVLSGS